jgi:hypothetical protein
MALSVGVDMNILSPIKDSQYVTDDVSWRRHEHTFTHKRLLMSDRWRSQAALDVHTFIYNISAMSDGVNRRTASTYTYFHLHMSHYA